MNLMALLTVPTACIYDFANLLNSKNSFMMLTHKQPKTHGYVFSIAVTDVLMLKHMDFSVHRAD